MQKAVLTFRSLGGVDEEVQARERELEDAREQEDPTALWRVLSAAAETGILGRIEDEEVRRSAGG